MSIPVPIYAGTRCYARRKQTYFYLLIFSQYLEEVPYDELDPVLHPVDGRVLPGQLDLVGVDVDGNDPLAREGKLDGVAAHAAEAVDDQVTLTPDKRREFFVYMICELKRVGTVS